MKVKELIQKLSEFDPELEVGYEHLYVDYAHQHDGEKLVDLGALRPGHYSKWIPLSEREPSDVPFEEAPFIVAIPESSTNGPWRYYMGDHLFCGLGTAAKLGGRWMYIEKTLEDGWARQGMSGEQIDCFLKQQTKV